MGFLFLWLRCAFVACVDCFAYFYYMCLCFAWVGCVYTFCLLVSIVVLIGVYVLDLAVCTFVVDV